jgi:hypothetical protein
VLNIYTYYDNHDNNKLLFSILLLFISFPYLFSTLLAHSIHLPCICQAPAMSDLGHYLGLGLTRAYFDLAEVHTTVNPDPVHRYAHGKSARRVTFVYIRQRNFLCIKILYNPNGS